MELECRAWLGISQQSMANLLGVSRSLIGLVEKGQRRLPTSALLQLNELISAYQEATDIPIDQEQIKKEREERLEILQRIWQDTQWELQNKQKEYDALKLTKTQMQNQIKTLSLLQSKWAKTSVTHQSNLIWIEVQLYEARQQLAKLSMSKILKLEIKLASLQYTLSNIQEQIAKIESETHL